MVYIYIYKRRNRTNTRRPTTVPAKQAPEKRNTTTAEYNANFPLQNKVRGGRLCRNPPKNPKTSEEDKKF